MWNSRQISGIGVRFGSIKRPFSSATRQQAYVQFVGPQGPQKPHNRQDGRHWDPRMKAAVVVGLLGGGYYVSHLEQVPNTGRWRFMNTSPNFEAKVGEALRKQIREELRPATLPQNHPISRHVRRVVARVLQASSLGMLRDESEPGILSPFGVVVDSPDLGWNPDGNFGGATTTSPVYGPGKTWDVIVVNDEKMVNAMASPGIIVVFTGILPVCQDEEGLAAVLSHEIGHVVARHTAERMSSQTIAWGVLLLISALFGIDMGITNVLQTYLMALPNSRKQEKEADIIGLRLMSRACYDPAAAPQMFGRLARLEAKIRSKVDIDFFQTHPSSESRVKLLEEALPEGYAILEANPQCDGVRQQLEAFKATALPMKVAKNGEIVFI